MVDVALQFLVNGLVTGCFYALMALGLAMIFGLMEVVNFAHGEFFVMGGVVAYAFCNVLGVDFYSTIAIVVALMFAFGAAVDRLLIRPLRGQHLLSTALVTIGLSIFLLNTMLITFGTSPQALATPFARQPIFLGPVVITEGRLFAVIVGAVAILLVYLLINRTKLGRAMRATFQQKEAAALVGVNIEAVYTFTFAFGTAMAAVAGVLLGAIFVVHPSTAEVATLKAFVVVILGGMTNLPGAVAGGILLGVVESLWGGFVSTGYMDVIGFVMVILILLFRPSGLFSASAGR
jgi:branched-chain amino acid transport system permease protein